MLTHPSPMFSVCVASVVRIVMMDRLVKSQDFTWAMCQVFIWSCCEPFIGIVCACLPTYAPLVRHWWTSTTSSQKYGSSKYASNRSQSSRRDWGQKRSAADTTMQGDDEVELTSTVNISGTDQPYNYHVTSRPDRPTFDRDIVVTKDFTWTKSSMA
jgi:hypothetical protein